MSDLEDEALALREVAYRMSQGIEIKTHKHMLRAFRNTFYGEVRGFWLRNRPTKTYCCRWGWVGSLPDLGGSVERMTRRNTTSTGKPISFSLR